MRDRAIETVAGFVKPCGRLRVIARTRPEGSERGKFADEPPWPLTPAVLARFEATGFGVESRLDYHIRRDMRSNPHCRVAFRLGNV